MFSSSVTSPPPTSSPPLCTELAVKTEAEPSKTSFLDKVKAFGSAVKSGWKNLGFGEKTAVVLGVIFLVVGLATIGTFACWIFLPLAGATFLSVALERCGAADKESEKKNGEESPAPQPRPSSSSELANSDANSAQTTVAPPPPPTSSTSKSPSGGTSSRPSAVPPPPPPGKTDSQSTSTDTTATPPP